MKNFNSKIVCTYLYSITKYGYPPPAEDTLNYIEEMTSLGFTTIELEGIREEHLTKVYDLRYKIKNSLEEKQLTLPYFCVVLPGLSSSDEKERNKNIELFKKGCETAAIIESKGVLDNSPIPPYQFPDEIPVIRHYEEESLQSAFLPDNFNWESYYEMLVSTFQNLCDIAANYDLTYQLHPASGVLINSADSFLHFYNSVGRENLRFNFDTANLFAIKENLPLSLYKLKGHIDYIHFSDNCGNKVEHLEAGKGKINWDNFFSALKAIDFDGYFGLDIGGDESGVQNLDEAYINSANFLENKWFAK
ncbi:MAG: sugar phosphate isomerase/epimerase [Melioribacteraceae bacterium]|nr:sugar phosphate isomerase/epimerase [Melioribacteraceae bacterium]